MSASRRYLSPTPRLAYVLAAVALSALVLPPTLALLGGLAALAAAAADAWTVRRVPAAVRTLPRTLARGVPAALEVALTGSIPGGAHLRVRQPATPEFAVDPAEGDGHLSGRLVPRRRGRHHLPAPALRVTGRLGLGRFTTWGGAGDELAVYPDLPAAHRLVAALRQGRFRDPGLRTRGPLGLGTDFESIRDYLPDDDIRQVNWRASARTGRPMSNQYRVEQDRSVICCIDTGRLMSAPVGLHDAQRTRLDVALDAAVAVALVADELGDQCGAVAFDHEVRRRLAPRRAGGRGVVQALYDLEPTATDADYDLAFRAVASGKRAFVVVFTDLLEEAAARGLTEAVPALSRRHHVVVAGVADPDFAAVLRAVPSGVSDVLAAAVVVDATDARARAAAGLRRAGADVVEAPPGDLPAACVGAYLRAKARARL